MQNVLLLRFDEIEDLNRPADAVGSIAELDKTGAALPSVVDAATGRGRAFTSADGDGLSALDIDTGATLLTRDASIQVLLSWDIVAATAYGAPQTIYARGKGTAPAEYLGAAIELRVVNAALRIGELRWVWQDIAGVLKTQIGGHFQLPADGFIMLTATRRWVSSGRVVLRHYLGDTLLSEVESLDGSIGGGTTGTTSIGTRFTGGAWARLFDGVIDELRVVDGELSAEEVAATWDRITVQQPRGYQLVVEAHDPGFPISLDPSSRAQKETRMWGTALGFAAAQAENVRNNILPDRAYGAVLERWEAITKQAARPGDDVEKRRRRVVGRIRQKRGISIPGVGDALRDLLATDPANLDYLAFDQTVRDDLSVLRDLRWRYDPPADWTISGGATRVSNNAAQLLPSSWRSSLMSIGGDGRGVAMVCKIDPTTLATDGYVGIMLVNRGAWTGFFFGLRRDPTGAVIQVVTEPFATNVLGGVTVQAALGAAVAPVWLRIAWTTTGIFTSTADARFDVSWSTVSADGPFTTVAGVYATGARKVQWAGFATRTRAAVAAVVDAKISGAVVRAPYGERSFRWYVLRDLADPGDPDMLGADAIAQGLKQHHTKGHVITTTTTVYDSALTPYDLAPMGGI